MTLKAKRATQRLLALKPVVVVQSVKLEALSLQAYGGEEENEKDKTGEGWKERKNIRELDFFFFPRGDPLKSLRSRLCERRASNKGKSKRADLSFFSFHAHMVVFPPKGVTHMEKNKLIEL